MKLVASFIFFISLSFAPIPSRASCNCDPDVSFSLNPEWNGQPIIGATSVDVNLGNSVTNFVEAAWWQINGTTPPPATVATQVANFANDSWWRRVDTVNTFLNMAGSSLAKSYSDPWQSEPAFVTAPCKNVSRDVGAVCMFFFGCPGPSNCSMNWANTHTLGMDSLAPLLQDAGSNGYYSSSSNVGFWYLELMDARYSGLQFLMPNVYGSDMVGNNSVANLATALGQISALSINSQVKIGMFDDTSGWNSPGSVSPYNTTPPLASNPTLAAQEIANKWIAFFSQIPSQYWYTVHGSGRPIIYFYNGGTLGSTNSGTVIAQAKVDFNASQGVVPYVVVDSFFFVDPGMSNAGAADNEFIWNTLQDASQPGLFRSNTAPTYAYSSFKLTNGLGVTVDHANVKWDPIARNAGGPNYFAIANAGDQIIKSDAYLLNDLQRTTSDTILTIGTWNDLGEGTGINRNYDYFVNGAWQPPNYFMNDIRASQSQQSCGFSGTPTPAPALPSPNVLKVMMFPNPSSSPSTTKVYFDLSAAADQVTIQVFASSTILVKQISLGAMPAGWNNTTLKISSLASGLFFVLVKAKAGIENGSSSVAKWVLLK